MKRILLYIVILAAMLIVPVKRLDVGKLRPVQVVSLYKDDGRVVIETDTGDFGIGATATQALRNMEETTVGVIYLDTARYLLLTKNAEDAGEELRSVLKPDTRICYIEPEIDLEEAGGYLAAHGDLPRLCRWKKGEDLPVLTTFRKRLTFLKKVEKRA